MTTTNIPEAMLFVEWSRSGSNTALAWMANFSGTTVLGGHKLELRNCAEKTSP